MDSMILGFHSYSTVHWFLEFWWSICFLKGLVVFKKIAILIRLIAFDYFCYFLVRDGWFMDFMILGDFIAFPQCIGILNFCGSGFLEGISDYWENCGFGVFFLF